MIATPSNIATLFFNALNKDNLTFLMSLIGFLGTISGWAYFWVTTRKNLSMRISGYNWNRKGLLVYFQITNNSRTSIAINDISIILFGNEYQCPPIPTKVMDTTRRIGNEVVSRKEFFSATFPINLAPLCGNSGYLYFPFEPEIQQPVPNKACFVVRTNRGKEWKTLLPLDKVLG